MEFEAALTAIQTIGFPSACVILMFLFLQKEQEAHRQESAQITEAINALTIAITRLDTRISGEDND